MVDTVAVGGWRLAVVKLFPVVGETVRERVGEEEGV